MGQKTKEILSLSLSGSILQVLTDLVLSCLYHPSSNIPRLFGEWAATVSHWMWRGDRGCDSVTLDDGVVTGVVTALHHLPLQDGHVSPASGQNSGVVKHKADVGHVAAVTFVGVAGRLKQRKQHVSNGNVFFTMTYTYQTQECG
jgi:hypothetical protein